MLSNLLLAIGVIALILGLFAVAGLIAISYVTLFVVAAVCLVAGYFLRGYPANRL